MKKYIYLFRHGKTFYNKRRFFTGWKDSKLCGEGIDNAKKIASLLKNKKFEVAYCTRLSRSKQTLKIVLREHPECLEVIEDNRLIERSYGVLEGKSHDVFIKKFGEQEYNKIHRGFYEKAKNGESFSDVEKRVRSFIDDLKKKIQNEKINVAISAHGNSIRLFRKVMEKAKIDDAVKWVISYDKVYCYSFEV